MTRRIPQLHQAVPTRMSSEPRRRRPRRSKKRPRELASAAESSSSPSKWTDAGGRRGDAVRAVFDERAGQSLTLDAMETSQAAGLQEMRRPFGTHLAARLALLALGAAVACGGTRPAPAVARSTAERANGRAYDGAPPTIPHEAVTGTCVTCHDGDGTVIDGVGIAPASPHGDDAAAGSMRRCRQCHAPTQARALLVASRFTGLAQGPWKGQRATPGAPPTIPHALQLREQCAACHDGPGARVEYAPPNRRTRCRQCQCLKPLLRLTCHASMPARASARARVMPCPGDRLASPPPRRADTRRGATRRRWLSRPSTDRIESWGSSSLQLVAVIRLHVSGNRLRLSRDGVGRASKSSWPRSTSARGHADACVRPGPARHGALYFDQGGRRENPQQLTPLANVRSRMSSGNRSATGRMGYTSGAEAPSGVAKIEAGKRQHLDSRLVASSSGRFTREAVDGVRAMRRKREAGDGDAVCRPGRLCPRRRIPITDIVCRRDRSSRPAAGTALAHTQCRDSVSIPRPPSGDAAPGQYRQAARPWTSTSRRSRWGRRRLSVRARRNGFLRWTAPRTATGTTTTIGVRAGGRGRLSMDQRTVASVGPRWRVPRERR